MQKLIGVAYLFFIIQSVMNRTWTHITSTGTPSPRFGHSAIVYNNSILIFGGSCYNTNTSELYRFDIKSKRWYLVITKGPSPSPKRGHTAVLWDHQMIVFGGYTDQPEDEFHSLDMQKCVWKAFDVKVSARYYHAAIVKENQMFIHGGYRERILYDFVVVNLDTKDVHEIQQKGEKPLGRYGHTIVEYNDDFYMFGGFTHFDTSQLYKFHIASSTWTQIDFSRGPEKRTNHSAVVANHSMLVLMGNTKCESRSDLWEWRFDTREWRQLDAFRVISRAYHTAVVAGDEMIVFGGRHEYDECLNDVWCYVVRDEEGLMRNRMMDALRKMQFVDAFIYS